MEHDHTDEGHEEAYVLVEGEATVTVDEEEVAMAAGDAIRPPPDVTPNQVRASVRVTLLVRIGRS